MVVLAGCLGSFAPPPDAPTADPAPASGEQRVAGTLPGCDPDTMPVLPQITADVKAEITAVFAQGQQAGRLHQVFMKYGDSITDNLSFLMPFATYYNNLATAHPELNALAALTATARPDGASNSFDSWSLGARRGWTTQELLQTDFSNTLVFLRPTVNNRAGWTRQPYGGAGWQNPWALACGGANPVVCEANRLRGAFAVVQIGTNDLSRMTIDAYKANLQQILVTLKSMGVVPIVSTIPPIGDARNALVRPLNQAIIDVARGLRLPVWNFNRQMLGVAGAGVSGDFVHPSCVDHVVLDGPETACLSDDPSINAAGFVDPLAVASYGFNARNLGFLQAYQHVRDEIAPYIAADAAQCN